MEKEPTLGEILNEKIDKAMSKYNDVITNLFIYGPDILNKTVSELRSNKDKSNKDESND